MPMSDRERFDAFVKLADLRTVRWNARRQLEWRATLGLWVLMASAAYYLKVRPPEVLLLVILVGIILIHAFSIIRSSARSQQDMGMAFYYIEHAEQCLSSSFPAPRERPKAIYSMSIGELWTIGGILGPDLDAIILTALLALASYFLIGHATLPNAICGQKAELAPAYL